MERRTVLFLIALIILYLAGINAHVGIATDDTYYTVLAESLSNGRYNNEAFVTTPAFASLPPIYPLLLVPFVKLGFVGMKVLSVILAVVSLLLLKFVFPRVRNQRDAGVLKWTLVLTALNPFFFYFAHSIQSEMAYLFVSILALIVGEHAIRTRKAEYFALTAIFIVLAYLTRPTGVALIAGFALAVLYFGRKTKRWQIGALVFVCVLFLIPAIAWQQYAADADTGDAVSNFFLVDFMDTSKGTITAADLAKRGAGNAYDYLGPALFKDVRRMGLFNDDRLSVLFTIAGIAAWLIVLLGFIKKARWSFVDWYVIIYGVMLLLFSWASFRYLVPVLPFLLYYFVHGIMLLFKKRARVLFGIFLLIFIVGSFLNIAVQQSHQEYGPEWVDFITVAEHVKSYDAQATFMTTKCSFFYLYADHQCLPYPDRAQIEKTMKKHGMQYAITNTIQTSRSLLGYSEPVLTMDEWLNEHPRFVRIARFNTASIYQYVGS